MCESGKVIISNHGELCKGSDITCKCHKCHNKKDEKLAKVTGVTCVDHDGKNMLVVAKSHNDYPLTIFECKDTLNITRTGHFAYPDCLRHADIKLITFVNGYIVAVLGDTFEIIFFKPGSKDAMPLTFKGQSKYSCSNPIISEILEALKCSRDFKKCHTPLNCIKICGVANVNGNLCFFVQLICSCRNKNLVFIVKAKIISDKELMLEHNFTLNKKYDLYNLATVAHIDKSIARKLIVSGVAYNVVDHHIYLTTKFNVGGYLWRIKYFVAINEIGNDMSLTKECGKKPFKFHKKPIGVTAYLGAVIVIFNVDDSDVFIYNVLKVC